MHYRIYYRDGIDWMLDFHFSCDSHTRATSSSCLLALRSPYALESPTDAAMATAQVAETEDVAGQKMVALGGMQNMAWAADTSKFGYKMLVKMGWAAGKGVGKELQGQATHVKIARRSENLGVGCSLKQAEVQGWSTTASSFADVLKTLNQKYGGEWPVIGASSFLCMCVSSHEAHVCVAVVVR